MNDFPIPLKNVLAQFESLSEKGSKIAFDDGGEKMFPKWRYSGSIFNKFGSQNHFQGLVRKGSQFFISGGTPKRFGIKSSDVFEMAYQTQNASGPLGSNLNGNRPGPDSKVIFWDKLDSFYWHPGGLGIMGSILAVPLQGEKKSVIRFYDTDERQDGKLKMYTRYLDRPEFSTGAVALTRLPDGKYLCATWSDSDKPKPPAIKRYHLDFYISKGDNIEDEFVGPITYYPAPDHETHHKFQGISFVWEGNGQMDNLYLLTFENTTNKAPVFRGDNIGRLFKINIPQEWKEQPDESHVPEIQYIATKKFDYNRKWCNMDAGSSAFVDDMKQLCVYSCYHFRKRNQVRCVEFKSSISDLGQLA